MKRRVAFQSRTDSTTPEGQLSSTWQDIYVTGAVVSWVSGSESRAERFTASANQIQVRIPYSQKALDLVQDNSFVVSNARYSIDIIDVDSDWRKTVVIRGSAFNERVS